MRKRLIPLFLLIAALYSCKKDRFNPGDIHLLKTERVDSAGAVYSRIFELDQAGRITKVSSALNNGTPVTDYTISYSGNVATILYGLVNSAEFYHHSITTYQLNSDYQPIQRIMYDTFSISIPTSLQRTAIKDTSRYEYDATGLLKKVTGTYFDSTWYNPGIIEIITTRRNYTRDYINSSDMLTGITLHEQEVYNKRRLSTQYNSLYTTDGTYAFEYIHNEPNKTDFVNAWLFAEMGVLYRLEYPLNKSYSRFPEKINYASVTRDASSGQITDSDSYTRTITLDHTKFGFISSYASGGRPQDKIELVYNR